MYIDAMNRDIDDDSTLDQKKTLLARFPKKAHAKIR